MSRSWIKECPCGSGEEGNALNDAQGIFVSYVCDKCEANVKSKYRPEIFTGYTQADVDEPIEPEDYMYDPEFDVHTDQDW